MYVCLEDEFVFRLLGCCLVSVKNENVCFFVCFGFLKLAEENSGEKMPRRQPARQEITGSYLSLIGD